jgi:hypothetical protein
MLGQIVAVSLRTKIKNALDEARILVLGTQVLLGFQYRAFFEPGFARLPLFQQYLHVAGLLLLLAVILLVMLPAARHRIVERGSDTSSLHRFTMNAVTWALVPFAVALAFDMYLAGATRGGRPALFLGIAALIVAAGFWFGIGIVYGRREMKQEEEGEMKLEDKIVQVLTEARVVLPGAQALFGFQLAITLMDAYERLPESSKLVHLASIGFIALAIVFLMAPAAFHRIVEHGEDTERFHRFASWMVLLAMAVLPPGFAGDVFVVVRKQTESARAGAAAAAATVAFFYGLWFAAMAVLRVRRRAAE